MDVSERCNKACEILRLTNDGGDLDALDLKLLEGAVNGFLNEKGYAAFNDLHARVCGGTYHRP